MSNEVVDWKSEMANQAKAAAALERPSITQISTKSGVMSYQGQPVPGNKLRAVVIASVFEHRYYTGRFDANNPTSPVCFAFSVDGEEMAPHADSSDAQCQTACNDCPKFAWGSDPNGGRGKACKAVRRLALVPMDALKANAQKAEMAMLWIPVTSVKFWANYVNAVASHNRPPWGVVTEISLTPDAKTQFKMNFDCVELLPDDMLGAAHSRIEQAIAMLTTPYAPQEAQAPAPTSNGKAKKY